MRKHNQKFKTQMLARSTDNENAKKVMNTPDTARILAHFQNHLWTVHFNNVMAFRGYYILCFENGNGKTGKQWYQKSTCTTKALRLTKKWSVRRPVKPKLVIFTPKFFQD